MKFVLRIRKADSHIFDQIAEGKKKVETRVATERYKKTKDGDTLIFLCDGKRLDKEIKKVKHFRSVGALFKKYKISDIFPDLENTKEGLKEAEGIYYRFSGYKKKIRYAGIMAFEL
jgi:ASC-1-like (ASCH) protein